MGDFLSHIALLITMEAEDWPYLRSLQASLTSL